MATETRTFTAAIWSGGGVALMARVMTDDVNVVRPIKQADLSSITYTIRPPDGTTPVTGALTIASVIFDVLQTGAVWTIDATGFSFSAVFAGTLFALAGVYRVAIKFVLLNPLTSPAFLEYELTAQPS